MRARAATLFESMRDLLDAAAGCYFEEHGPCLMLTLEMSGVPMLLKHVTANSANVRVYVNFGSVPEAVSPAALRRLLEINTALAESDAGTMGCDGTSGDVVFSFKVRIESTTAQSMLSALKHAAAQACRWRGDHFLNTGHGESRPHLHHLDFLA